MSGRERDERLALMLQCSDHIGAIKTVDKILHPVHWTRFMVEPWVSRIPSGHHLNGLAKFLIDFNCPG